MLHFSVLLKLSLLIVVENLYNDNNQKNSFFNVKIKRIHWFYMV
jgi:hypothetical protein